MFLEVMARDGRTAPILLKNKKLSKLSCASYIFYFVFDCWLTT